MGSFKNIQLIVFDLDGTLVNSQYDLLDAVNHALEKLDRPLIHPEQMPGMLGGGIRQLIRMALGTEPYELEDQALKLFKSYYEKHYANKTTFYDGVEETLQNLKNYRKAVLSNKAHIFTLGIMRKTGYFEDFDLILGAQPDKYALKPSPEGLQYLLNELQIAPEHTLVVGDSTHDIETARALDAKVCAVTYGYRPASLLRKAKPDLLIDTMPELLTYL